jgi:D-inositol-3-phosphate glycosyltransferase
MSSLLIAGLHLPGSGLTNVLTALVSELRHVFDVRCLGFEPALRSSEADVAIEGCPARIRRGSSRAFAADPQWLERELAGGRTNTVLVSGPAFLAGPLLRQLQPFRDRTRIVLYLPVEGSLANDDFVPIVEGADICVMYTEDARAGLASRCAKASAQRPDYRAPQIDAAGHGFDRSAFFPLAASDERARRIAARRAVYASDLDDAFIILNSNRPYLRKRLDLSIAAFGLFARDKPDAHLHLHTGSRGPQVEQELTDAIAQTGVGERIHVTPGPDDPQVRPLGWLNTLYNACDVGLTTAMGEGWGLGLFEHAATRAALVVPAHTSFIENWTGAALLVPAPDRQFVFYEGADMDAVTPEGVAAALDALYRDRALRDDLASTAFARANHERHTWKSVAARLAGLLQETS